MQDLGAGEGGHRGPDLEAGLRGADRLIDLRGAGARDLGDRGLVDRREVLERGGRGDALPADPVLGRDLDALDLRVRARDRPLGSFVPER
jgi:hypothetical protein